MITSSIKAKYTKMLVSWGIINFYGPIKRDKPILKETSNYKDKQPIGISDISLIRGFN